MKKWIVLFAVVAVIGGAWYYLRTYYRVTPVWYQPKFGAVSRGDIRVPITAAGLIEPNLRIQVKSKASGEVIELPVYEGSYAKKGDVLLKLKPTDEQRQYDARKADLDRATTLLDESQVAVKSAEADILVAEADVERLAAQAAMSAFELDKSLNSPEAAYTPQERLNIAKQHEINLAQKKAADARLTNAHNGLARAKDDVKLQEAALTVAKSNFGDAEERLAETTIIAKQDALVTEVAVKISEVIQGGMNTFTGGTIVMALADVSRKKVVARLDESDYGRVLNISPITALPENPGLRESASQPASRTASQAGAESDRRSGKVRVTVDAFPEEQFDGLIERVEPQGKLNAGSAIIQYDVHVWITDKNAHKLPLGAQAQVEFTVQSAPNALRIPSDAVKNYQGKRGVWIKIPPEPRSNEQWNKKFVECRFGITDGEYTQVIEPAPELKEGAEIYTKLPVDREEIEK
jgi:HlyD family secretion protein